MKNKKISLISIIMFIIFIINVISISIFTINSNMIPNKYIMIGIAVLSFLAIIYALIIFIIKNKVLNIIIYLMIILTGIGSIFVYRYVDKALDTLDNIATAVIETEDFYIVTSSKSQIKELKDLENKYLYMFSNNENYTDIITKIDNEIEVNYSKLDSLEKLSDKVISNNDSGILITASQYEMISELYPKFKEVARILTTLQHKIGTEKTQVEMNNDYTIETGKFNVYVSGIDTSGKISNVSRSDSNMIITVDMSEEKVQVLMTSIPRDYYVNLHTSGKKDKLTHSGIYGINETISTVEDFMNIDINYYARVNFTTLISLVDSIGGIEVNSDLDFNSGGYKFKKGINYLNGKQALVFARERYSFKDGDIQRNKNQQKVIEGIVNKVITTESIINNYSKILDTLSSSFQTNITSDQIAYLIKNQIDNFKDIDINTYSLFGSGTHASTYSMGSQKLYVMIPNKEAVSTARKKIIKVLE